MCVGSPHVPQPPVIPPPPPAPDYNQQVNPATGMDKNQQRFGPGSIPGFRNDLTIPTGYHNALNIPT